MSCFGVPLHSQEIDALKSMLRSQDDSRGLIDVSGGISFQGFQELPLMVIGFLALQRAFIMQGRLETVWTILQKYGYSKDLPMLREEYLHPR